VTDTAARTILDIMRDTTSLPLPELMGQLKARRVKMTAEEFDAAWQDESLALLARVGLTDPELTINLGKVLAGRVFTHRLHHAEVALDLLFTLPDFAGIWPILEISPFDQLDGQPIKDDFDDDELQAVIRLQPGTLSSHAAGSLITITVGEAGLVLAAAAEPQPTDLAELSSAVVKDYHEVFGDEPELRGPVPLEEFLGLTMTRNASIFTQAGWPVADLLTTLALDHDNGSIAAVGFDFAAADDARAAIETIEMLVETYDLAETAARVVLAFSDKIEQIHHQIHGTDDDDDHDEVDPDVEELVPLLGSLADPMVVVAIAEENLISDPHLGYVLLLILTKLESVVPRRAAAGFFWLLGRSHDVTGDVASAAVDYQRALTLDVDHFPAMRELASLAALSGDAKQAVSLLLRAGVPSDDPELAMVAAFAGEEQSDLGRNDNCWCGSGTKYKKCHLGRSEYDLAARREWLFHKASQWVRNSSGRELLVELAAAKAAPDTDPSSLIAAVNNPLVMDVALFEGALLADFLETRGDLLPADEYDLALAWSSTRRNLYRVESGTHAAGFSLMDLLSLEVVTVAELPKVKHADLLCLRLLPIGDQLVVSGGVQFVGADSADLVLGMLAGQDDDVDPELVITVLSAAAGQ